MKIKNHIKKTPLLGQAVKKSKYFLSKYWSNFTNSRDYWENRYRSGGNSGDGSFNKLAKFKAEFLNDFVANNHVCSVLEYGVGDGNQLMLANYPSYIGFDVSHSALHISRMLFRSDNTKSFKHMDEYCNERADLTLSLDVIYHLVEDEVFDDYMKRLFLSSDKYVIIYSSNSTDADFNNKALHVRHRKFVEWVERNMPNWSLVHYKKNIFPYDPEDNSAGSFSDFYVYSKTMHAEL